MVLLKQFAPYGVVSHGYFQKKNCAEKLAYSFFSTNNDYVVQLFEPFCIAIIFWDSSKRQYHWLFHTFSDKEINPCHACISHPKFTISVRTTWSYINAHNCVFIIGALFPVRLRTYSSVYVRALMNPRNQD